MEKKKWIIKNDGAEDYEVQLLNASKIKINDEEIRITKLKSKSLLGVITEYELPIEEKEVLLVYNVNKYILVVDGVNYDTDKEYTSIAEIPKWTYIFVFLNAINFINGVVGVCFAFLGISLSFKISTSSKFNTLIKILLSLLTLVGMFAIVFLIAILLNSALY